MPTPFRALLAAIRRRSLLTAKPSRIVPPLPDAEAAADILAGTIDPLLALMDHPQLGGPGFLTVQLRPPEGSAAVTAQFPNIRETLYRRIIRGTLDPAELAADGVSPALLDLHPGFETGSGGMVLLTVTVPDLPLGTPPAGSTDRSQLLSLLAAALRRRYPRLTVRCLGWDILLDRSGR